MEKLSSTSITTAATGTTTTAETKTTTSHMKLQIPNDALRQLQDQRYVILPNFIPPQLQTELRNDIQTLRGKERYFKKANIGQDSTNTYNSNVRITETCFLGKDKFQLNTIERNTARETLYTVVEDIATAISTTVSSKLDHTLTELLYAYYPQGGYYRTHMDAIPNSASYLRQYSFLMYLNDRDDSDDHDSAWNTTVHGGQLRLYLNQNVSKQQSVLRTYDFSNDDYQKEYDTILDVTPSNGTLVMFDSHVIPHEVLNTDRERYVIIGWFNRKPSLPDFANLAEGATTTTNNSKRLALLTIAVGMMTLGIYNLILELLHN